MEKSKYKWVYPVYSDQWESPHTHWVYDVDQPGPGIEEVWLVDTPFYQEHWQHVEWVLFVGDSRRDSQHTKKVYVAGYDPYYEYEFARRQPNLPRKLRLGF